MQRSRWPGSTRSTSAGTMASAVAPARAPSTCEPCPPEGRTRPSVLDDPGQLDLPGSGRPARVGHGLERPVGVRVETGQPPQRREDEDVERDERAHRVAGQGDDRRCRCGPTTPQPCGIPGRIATLTNSTPPSAVSTSLTVS